MKQADEGDELNDARAAHDRYYAYQTAVGGTSASVGPAMDTSVCALQMLRDEAIDEEVYEHKRHSRT
jgi:hypothetical protein